MRIVLHIGPDAQVAARLQAVLVAKRRRLARLGVLVPRSAGPRSHAALALATTTRITAARAARGIWHAADQADLRARLADALASEIAEAQPDTLLLSAHELGAHLVDPEEIAALHAFLAPFSAEIAVLAHIDDPARVALRHYARALAEGRTRPLSQELSLAEAGDWWASARAGWPDPKPEAGLWAEMDGAPPWLDAAALQRAWEAGFGPGAVRLRTVCPDRLWGERAPLEWRQALDLPGALGKVGAVAPPPPPASAWLARCRQFNLVLRRWLARNPCHLPRAERARLVEALAVEGPPADPGGLSALSRRFAPTLAAVAAAHPGVDPAHLAAAPMAPDWAEADPLFGFRPTQYLLAALPRLGRLHAADRERTDQGAGTAAAAGPADAGAGAMPRVPQATAAPARDTDALAAAAGRAGARSVPAETGRAGARAVPAETGAVPPRAGAAAPASKPPSAPHAAPGHDATGEAAVGADTGEPSRFAEGLPGTGPAPSGAAPAPSGDTGAASPGPAAALPPAALDKLKGLLGTSLVPHDDAPRPDADAPPFPPVAARRHPGRRAIVACMKDEAPYLLEWIAHHRAIGFDDFLIYTNDCSDGTDALLDRLEARGIVRHRRNDDWRGNSPQQHALDRALTEPAIREAAWVAHIDTDEFVNIHVGDGTLDALFDAVPGATHIAMTWRLFGHAGIDRVEDALVTERFTRAAPRHCPKPHTVWGIKTLFAQTGAYARLSCHRPNKLVRERADGVRWVNGSGRDVTPAFLTSGWRSTRRTVGYDLVQLNHYALRSAEGWLIKRRRGRALHVDRQIGLNYWIRMDWSDCPDRSIHRHLPRLRDALALLASDAETARLHRAGLDWHRAQGEALLAEPEMRALYDRVRGLRLRPVERVAYALALDMES